MRRSGDYTAAARGFASGTPDGLAAWLVLSSEALHAGAREALAIAVRRSFEVRSFTGIDVWS